MGGELQFPRLAMAHMQCPDGQARHLPVRPAGLLHAVFRRGACLRFQERPQRVGLEDGDAGIVGYFSNHKVVVENEKIYHQQTGNIAEDGTTEEFLVLNDVGYDWWTTDGKLALEDSQYCAFVS